MRRTPTIAGLACVVTAVVLAPTAGAAATSDDPLTIDSLPQVTQETLNSATWEIDTDTAWEIDAETVWEIDAADHVFDVEQTRTDGDETVVTLDADILFDFGEAKLSDTAVDRIGEIVEDVTNGADVEVSGHTDNIGSEAENKKLSKKRAEAVADAVREARPDLDLTVKGYGESRPVAPNTKGGKDNPEGRAKNRRVEIRYAD